MRSKRNSTATCPKSSWTRSNSRRSRARRSSNGWFTATWKRRKRPCADATGSRRCPTTGSWELTINYACHSDHRVLAVYRPLHSEAFDLFYHKARSRFGTQPVPMNNILQETLKSKRKGARPVSVALIADQTPPWHEIKHWYRFLDRTRHFFRAWKKWRCG